MPLRFRLVQFRRQLASGLVTIQANKLYTYQKFELQWFVYATLLISGIFQALRRTHITHIHNEVPLSKDKNEPVIDFRTQAGSKL